ncbi:MAG TPA: 2-dehydropantoate 2-reductase N-terminal domain-containing protein [Anaerolineae bacterium]|nr:2-dehydropantoate 2-reductase N-terminal domain-containing protein [Anaerolineae bacterium]
MHILFYGAGVLGSLYAARCQEAGHDVSILARGRRLADLCVQGIVLEEAATGARTTAPVHIVDALAPNDSYDWIVVLVRRNQLDEIVPILATNHATPNVLLMVNNASGVAALADAVGRERTVLGFPGAGGTREGHVVRYNIVSGLIQPTTLGELHGHITPRLREIAAVFQAGGFPVALSTDMDAWLKTHVAVVSPIANALYLAGGDNYRLARTRDGLVLLARAIKEGFRVLHALHIPVTPFKYRLLPLVPEPLLVMTLQRMLATEWATTVMAHHANAARDEMQQLADEFRALARVSGTPTPALDQLYAYIDPAMSLVSEGAAILPLDWRGVWAASALFASLAAGSLWLRRKHKRA